MKKLLTIMMVLVLVCSISVPALASSEDEYTYTLWNAETGEYTVIAPEDYTTGSPEPMDPIYYPRAYVWSFISYSQSNYTYDYEYNWIAGNRVDNSLNSYTSTDLYCETSSSGTVSASTTGGFGLSAEGDAVVAKVKATIDLSATKTVSWTSGYRFNASTQVPPNKVGYIDVYVVGIYSDGTGYYSVLDTSTDEITYEQRGLGGVVPKGNYFNFKVRISNT